MLGETLNKSPSIQFSKLSKYTLTTEQKEYATLDVIKSLEIYLKAYKHPDLSLRSNISYCINRMKVDIVPSHRTMYSDVYYIGAGVITFFNQIILPPSIYLTILKKGKNSVIITVENFTSPNLIIPIINSYSRQNRS